MTRGGWSDNTLRDRDILLAKHLFQNLCFCAPPFLCWGSVLHTLEECMLSDCTSQTQFWNRQGNALKFSSAFVPCFGVGQTFKRLCQELYGVCACKTIWTIQLSSPREHQVLSEVFVAKDFARFFSSSLQQLLENASTSGNRTSKYDLKMCLTLAGGGGGGGGFT